MNFEFKPYFETASISGNIPLDDCEPTYTTNLCYLLYLFSNREHDKGREWSRFPSERIFKISDDGTSHHKPNMKLMANDYSKTMQELVNTRLEKEHCKFMIEIMQYWGYGNYQFRLIKKVSLKQRRLLDI